MMILSSVMKKGELQVVRAQCTRAGIEVKSVHDIRRTVASEIEGV